MYNFSTPVKLILLNGITREITQIVEKKNTFNLLFDMIKIKKKKKRNRVF